MTVVVVAKTCTGLPTINGVMENITANLGDKVGHNQSPQSSLQLLWIHLYETHKTVAYWNEAHST